MKLADFGLANFSDSTLASVSAQYAGPEAPELRFCEMLGLAEYLPSKTEYLVFCKPTEAQASVYRAVIGSTALNAALGSPAISLELITILKKVCNSPSLLLKKLHQPGVTSMFLLQIFRIGAEATICSGCIHYPGHFGRRNTAPVGCT